MPLPSAISGEEEVEYIDWAAPPFWLELICGKTVKCPAHYKGLRSLGFLNVTWMVSRAVAQLVSVDLEGHKHHTVETE